jgi:hypothetical protein
MVFTETRYHLKRIFYAKKTSDYKKISHSAVSILLSQKIDLFKIKILLPLTVMQVFNTLQKTNITSTSFILS